MKIEDQVCSPEQAIRLNELGIEQRSYFYHTILLDVIHLDYLPMNPEDRIDIVGSAFNVAELGAMLPEFIRRNSNISYADLVGRKDGTQWLVGYDCDSPTEGGYGADIKSLFLQTYAQTEAQARASMLIGLLENNKITANEANDRLKSAS